MSTNTCFFFAKHVLVARAMASDTERSPKMTVNDDELLEHNKCASELLDDVHLREMSIRGLEDGSHMETKKDKIAKDNNATPQSFLWPPNPGQLSLFLFPTMPFWGLTMFGHCPGSQCPSGSTSATGQPGSSSVQG